MHCFPISHSEFERVEYLGMAHEIWTTLEKVHEGNDHVKSRLFETYRREYENFEPMYDKYS
jgi:hypothetical protein